MKNYFNKFDKSNPTISKLNLFTKYYRNFIYKQIIKHGNFNEKKTILDYGCGNGYLKKINIKKKIYLLSLITIL